MPTKTRKPAKRAKKQSEIVLTRVFDAPRERVWNAWTKPEEVKRWWGPKGFTTPYCTIDLRIGGRYLHCMRSPDGKDYWGTGVYREIVPMEKLVLTSSFADAKGNVVDATHYGMSADIPLEMLVTVTVEDLGGRTKVTLRHAGIPAGPDRAGAEQTMSESFEKLATALSAGSSATQFARKGKRELVFTRAFDAPRAVVWKAWTDPRLIPKWWGPRRYETIVDEMDVRPGGRWRFRNRDAEGNDFAFHGEYFEVVPPERIVQTFVFEGAPRSHMVETATLKEERGKTVLTITSAFHGPTEDLEAMIGSGMEEGARETYDRFAELLAEM